MITIEQLHSLPQTSTLETLLDASCRLIAKDKALAAKDAEIAALKARVAELEVKWPIADLNFTPRNL